MNVALNVPKALIADDDAKSRGEIGVLLHHAGLAAISASSGNEADSLLASEDISLAVLAIRLRGISGLQVCERLRQRSNAPVVILGEHRQERDLLAAFTAGADAYLTKPLRPRELLARIQALLRRADHTVPRRIHAGCYQLDTESHTLHHANGNLCLTRLECRLLHLLMMNAGCTVTIKTLQSHVWTGPTAANRNMLKQIVFRLRRKLVQNAHAPSLLKTTPDGYKWLQGDMPAAAANPLPHSGLNNHVSRSRIPT